MRFKNNQTHVLYYTPWKMVEDKPFLLGFGHFSGAIYVKLREGISKKEPHQGRLISWIPIVRLTKWFRHPEEFEPGRRSFVEEPYR